MNMVFLKRLEDKVYIRYINPDFKVVEFDHFKMSAGLPLVLGKWCESSKSGEFKCTSYQ